MADEDLNKALAALAIAGIGIAAFVALDESSQRRRFKEALKGKLSREGIGLVDATIGRQGSRRFWRITYNHYHYGIMRSDVRIPAGVKVVSAEMLQRVLDQIDKDVN